jgi:hypothetical protein
MNVFWSNVFAGSIGAVLSAAAIAAVGELRPLGLHLIIPEDAVIPMSGACPPGWRGYQATSGPYMVAPASSLPQAQGRSGGGGSAAVYAESDSPSSGVDGPALIGAPSSNKLVIPRASRYIVLSLCQRL